MRKIFPVSVRQGGYSEPILQLCYLAGIGIIFLLVPHVGLFLSILTVGIPAFFIALWIANRQERPVYAAPVRAAQKKPKTKHTNKSHFKLIPAKAV